MAALSMGRGSDGCREQQEQKGMPAWENINKH